MYYQISCKNSCRKTIEATIMKKSTKIKQIDIRNKHFYCCFFVSVDFLWQSFKHTDKLKMSFFGDVNVASMRIVIKKALTIKRFLLLKCNYFRVY